MRARRRSAWRSSDARERSRRRVDPESQHVNRLVAPGGRDLDARDEPNAERSCRGCASVESGDRVVIGEREHADARCGGACDELRGGERSVGAVGMRVQVDRERGGHEVRRETDSFERGDRPSR